MSNEPKTCLAFDFGAGSGRAVAVTSDGRSLAAAEVMRFPSAEYMSPEGLRWNAARLFDQLETGIRAALDQGYDLCSVGIDTWGLDFGYLTAEGQLLEDPWHYRDPRSARGFAASHIPTAALAQATQAQVLNVNTLFQLIADQNERPQIIARADRVLMMADLLAHHLTGILGSDLTLARTTGLHSVHEGWSREILEKAKLPGHLFTDLLTPATVRGTLRPEIRQRTGAKALPVVAVAGHDTASAVCGLPLQPGEAYLVAGSWNLLGFESLSIPAAALDNGFGAEGGVEGRQLMTKSLEGTLLLRLLRDGLSRESGTVYGFEDLAALARQGAQGAAARVDLPRLELGSAEGFLHSLWAQMGTSFMPQAAAFAVYDGLCTAICAGIEVIEQLTGAPVSCLRVGGGGARDAYFCTLLADRVGRPVAAGPVEASAMGNGALQLIALGVIPDLAAARRLIATSGLTQTYFPEHSRPHTTGRMPCSR